MDDVDLLKAYVEHRDQDAFAQLVRRHGGWLYSAARRQVGDAGLAEDVTQAVFVLLARRAKGLRGYRRLSGWLFLTLGYCVKQAMRQRARMERREREAAGMRPESVEEASWDEVAPLLETLVGGLGKADRDAVLLRFYEQKPLAEVGRAMGVSEEAARKRVDRAVEKLRGMLEKQGVTGTSAGLSAVLVGNVVQEAKGIFDFQFPISDCGNAHAIAEGAMKIMPMAKIKLMTTVVVVLVLAGSVGIGAEALRRESVSGAPSNSTTAPGVAAVLKATLKNGTSVELLGVAENPSDGKPWWRPDGVLLASRPYARAGVQWAHGDANRYFEFPVRVSGPTGLGAEAAETTTLMFSPSFDPIYAAGNAVPGLRTRLAWFADSETRGSLRVPIWIKSWQTETMIGRSAPNEPIVGGLSRVDVAGRGEVRLDQIADLGGQASLRVDEPIRGHDAVAIRVLSVDMAGKQHSSSGGNSATNDKGRCVGTLRFPLPLAQVREFVLQSRPYGGWVDFRDVSLRPGVQTQVQIVTSDGATVTVPATQLGAVQD